MKEIKLNNKRIVKDKLKKFGFENGEYSENILDGQFDLKLTVDEEGRLFSSLLETAFGDEYILHLVPDAQGEFVGAVKAAHNAVVDKFIASCCENAIFTDEQPRAVIEYARKKYGDELEFLWEKFDDDAILRRKDSGCWYAAILTVSRAKLGFDSDEKAVVIDLRMRPESASMIDGKRYLPGYHMNKKSWFTIVLDGTVPTEDIFEKIDESYRLASKAKK